jgi:hypothetical protein
MSASIIQRKAAFATVTGADYPVAVELDNPISEGSILVIACALVQTDGSGASVPGISVEDDKGNGYSPTLYSSHGSGLFANTYQGSAIPEAGAQTYILSFTAPAGQSAYTFLAGICVYELGGVSNIGNGSVSQSLSGLHEMSDLSAAISGLEGGTYGNLLVSIGAFLFNGFALSDADAVAAGSGWTLDGREAINGTFASMAIVFESQLVGPSSNPASTFSGSSNDTEFDGTILLAAYSLTAAISGGGSGGGGGTSTTFLGSVRVLGSAPTGPSNPFLGTVTVVGSAPSGVPNPYLGSVVLGTPGPSNTNPALGEVVVVAEVPTGETDLFLGTLEES